MFSFELFKEGLRRTRTLGILFAIGMLILGFFLPFIIIVDLWVGMIHSAIPLNQLNIGSIDVIVTGLIAPIIGTPIISISMFSFLNKRNSSDFFHSLPYKREKIFISFFLALQTWILSGLWLSSLLSILIFSISNFHIVNIISVLFALLVLTVAVFLISAIIVLSMSLTGNLFSNILTISFLLLFPQFLSNLFIDQIIALTRLISRSTFGFMGGNYNIAFNLSMSLLSFLRGWGSGLHIDWGISGRMISISIYSFLLGIIYLTIAFILFKKRESELAENNSRCMNFILKIAFSFIVTIPAIFGFSQIGGISFNEFGLVIFIYTLSFFIILCFDILITKKSGKIRLIFRDFLIVVALNIVIILGLRVTRNIILQEVNISNVTGITIEDWNFRSNTGMRSFHYDNTIYSNDDIINIVIDNFNDNIHISSRNPWFHEPEQIQIVIHKDNGRNLKRILHLNEGVREQLRIRMIMYNRENRN